MSEWKPIETAPKDGTPLLLFGIYPGDQQPLWWVTGGWQNGRFRGDYATPPPTHWLPLPAPPKPSSCTSSDAIQTGRSASPENADGG